MLNGFGSTCREQFLRLVQFGAPGFNERHPHLFMRIWWTIVGVVGIAGFVFTVFAASAALNQGPTPGYAPAEANVGGAVLFVVIGLMFAAAAIFFSVDGHRLLEFRYERAHGFNPIPA